MTTDGNSSKKVGGIKEQGGLASDRKLRANHVVFRGTQSLEE